MRTHILNSILIVLTTILFVNNTVAQEAETVPLKMVFNNSDGTVRLRWAPIDQEVWRLGIKYGYVVERRVIHDGKKMVGSSQKTILSGGPVMPAPSNIWEKECEHNDHALLIADAFYGELRAKKRGKISPTALFFNTIVENQEKHGFSLIAADLNYKAALLAGWGYTDTNVSPSSIYEYVVYLNYPGFEHIATDTVRVDMTKKRRPSVPVGLEIAFGEGVAKISWLQHLHVNPVAGYYIERSFDNKDFYKLSEKPFITSGKGLVAYNDSIPNDTYVFYRIRSVDCFGDISSPTKAVGGMSKRELSASPKNLRHTYFNYDTITVHWDFDPNQHDLIIGFEVYKSESSNGQYNNVSFFLPVTARSFNVPASNKNYFIVKAVGKGKFSTTSIPYFAPRPDLVPPEQPKGFTGTIDTTGIIKLRWKPNTDSDLKGYLLFASHNMNSIYVPTTRETFNRTNYTDSIDIRSGYKNKFFRLVAVDSTGNHSAATETLTIEIPDMIKPKPPLVINTFKRQDTVRIEWQPSYARDVKMQLVYRKESKDEKWRVLKRFDDNTSNMVEDYGLESGKTYNYFIIAVDSAGWESDPSDLVSMDIFYQFPPKKVEQFTAKFDQQNLIVELNWKARTEIKGYQLYKDEGEGNKYYFSSFIDVKENKFSDSKVKPFKTYNYKIRAVSKEGLYSPFETVKVEWK
jgi:uncharacterized protein